MTGFSEDGSRRHCKAGSGDVIESEAGVSGTRNAPRTLRSTAGPFTSRPTSFGSVRRPSRGATFSKLGICLMSVCSKKLIWHLLWLALVYVIRQTVTSAVHLSLFPRSHLPPHAILKTDISPRHGLLLCTVADSRRQAGLEIMHPRRRQLICTSIRAPLV